MIPEEIFPGVKPLLIGLRSRGVKVGLASSSKNAQTIIQVLHIQHEFDAVVDGTMVTHTKPDPEIFLLAARRLGVSPQDCLVFEDAAAGVEAALAAGMRCIGIGSENQLNKADRVFKSTDQFSVEMVHEF
jgi:beta-phosphoglucomutase